MAAGVVNCKERRLGSQEGQVEGGKKSLGKRRKERKIKVGRK